MNMSVVEYRLDEEPRRYQYRLFIKLDNVPLGIHHQEIAIELHLLEVEGEQSPFIVYDFMQMLVHLRSLMFL